MKICVIRLKNINSLQGEWEINFDQPPLSDAGLFAISGATGAGKTTILDAITAALYGEIPRYSKNDVRELLARGTGECYAEVEFETNGKRYRSKWSARRSRNDPSKNLQNAEMELAALPDGTIIESYLSRVPKVVESIVGLNCEQFLRSVLLAQGDFAKFLKASDNDRANLLEKMTGTDKYSEISKFAYEKSAAEQNKLQMLRLKSDDIQPLNPEDRNRLTDQRLATIAEAAALKLDIDQKRDFLELRKKFLESLQSAKSIEEKIISIDEQLRDAEKWLLENTTDGELPLALERIEASQVALASAKKLLSEKRSAADINLKEKEYLTKESEKVQKMAGNALQLSEQANAEAKRAEQSFISLLGDDSLDSLAYKAAKAAELHAAAEKITEYSGRRKNMLAELAELRLLYKTDKERANNLNEYKSVTTIELSAAEDRLKELRRISDLEKTIASYEEARKSLSPGRPCPLCGAEHHPFVEHYRDDASTEFEKKTREQELRTEELRRKKAAADIDIGKIESSQSIRMERAERLKREIAETEKRFEQIAVQYGITATISDEGILNAELIAALNAKEQLARKNRDALNAKKQYDSLGEKAQIKRSEFEKLLNERETIGARISEIEKISQIIEKELRERISDYEDAKNAALKAAAPHISLEQEINGAAIDELRRRGETFVKKSSRKISLTAELAALKSALEDKRNEIKQLPGNLETPEIDDESARLRLRELERKNEEILAAQGALELLIQQDDLRISEYSELKSGIDTQQKEYARWKELSDLIGSAAGDKFRKFAQGITLERLVALANYRLNDLTDRYALDKKSGDSLDLEIIDRYQANSRRLVASLSGGETFLVSLALALGLSDLASASAKIESLFIDEGFGSLDADTLDVAMSVLENLQYSGKSIGVISHVDAMKERVATKILVEKAGSGKSVLRIVAA